MSLENRYYYKMKPRKLLILFFLFLFTDCSDKQIRDKVYDVVVYGATSSGVITAYASKMLGRSVLLIDPGHRIGGLSSGGLGQTDIGNKYAVTGLARNFYRLLGDYYNEFESWKFEPKAALMVFQAYIDRAQIPVIYDHCIVGVEKQINHIESIEINFTDKQDRANPTVVKGDMFIDCSYEGDLMAMAGISYTIGRESNATYGETLNGVQYRHLHQFPDNIDPYMIPGNPESGLLWGISNDTLEENGTGDLKIQAYNYRICVTNDPDNLLPITRPNGYDSSKYELLIRLMKTQPDKTKLNDYFIWSPMPNNKTDINNRGGFSTDMIGMNYEYPEADWDKRKKIIEDHISYTKGIFYFLGHDSRVPDELRKEISAWGYPKDEYTDSDFWSPQLYIREARRMIGSYVMTEHHCIGDSLVGDPIGLAAYTMDSHNCQRVVVKKMVKNEGDVEVGDFPPYPIAYRSLLPQEDECDNLIVPVCLSASHIAFGSIRMEPVFMVLGQVSAIAASLALEHGTSVQDVNFRDINQIMEKNPLLDGTPPDIAVDNEDNSISYHGDWKSEKHFMRNYKNSLMILNNPEAENFFKFLIQNDINAQYKIYFYCPSYNWGSERETYPENIKLEVDHAEGIDRVEINYTENVGEWAYLGEYLIDNDREYYVKLSTVDGVRPLIADAILLVPVIN